MHSSIYTQFYIITSYKFRHGKNVRLLGGRKVISPYIIKILNPGKLCRNLYALRTTFTQTLETYSKNMKHMKRLRLKIAQLKFFFHIINIRTDKVSLIQKRKNYAAPRATEGFGSISVRLLFRIFSVLHTRPIVSSSLFAFKLFCHYKFKHAYFNVFNPLWYCNADANLRAFQPSCICTLVT